MVVASFLIEINLVAMRLRLRAPMILIIQTM
jgi:hypothetical protein